MKRYKYQDQEQVIESFRAFKQQQQESIWNFPQNPGVGPIPTPAAWIYSNYSGFTATLANSSTAVTAVNIGTSMLAVGQVVTGPGIVNNPPTTIAAIPSGTTLTLSQATTASAAGSGVALNFQGVPGLQSPLFSNYSFYAVPSPSATDILGCAYDIPEVQTINNAQTFIPAPGVGFFSLGQGTTTASALQAQTAAGTWTTIFTGLTTGASYSPTYMVDGTNFRINIAGSAAATFTFYRWRNATYR